MLLAVLEKPGSIRSGDEKPLVNVSDPQNPHDGEEKLLVNVSDPQHSCATHDT